MGHFWNDKQVLITGGNGFLGSHLTNLLIKEGVKPVVLVYEENPGGLFETEGMEGKTTVIRGDVCDLPLMEQILAEHRIDTVYHLAAQAIVDQAMDDPLATFEANIRGTWNILEASKKNAGVKRVIIASSDKAYGEHDNLPYVEDEHALRAAYPYEVSKACADLISQSFAKTFAVPAVITRCANLYGPGDLKMNRLIPRTIQELHHGRPPVIRDTGSSLRDYLYVGDAAEAYRMLAEKMDDSFRGHAFNFSTNAPLSVAEAIQAISNAMGKDIAPTTIQTHGKEIRHQYASFAKAAKMLDWRPTHTFEEGLAKTIPWYVAHIELSAPTHVSPVSG